MKQFTHKAQIYGFDCYFNEDNNEVQGTNWWNQKMIELFIWFDLNLTNNDAFNIKIIERLDKDVASG